MRRDKAISGVILACGMGALVAHASRYDPYITDDALISLRYAERLLEGKGLTWNDGEFVEGYSNLLWVLACAFLGRFGVDLIDATRILGLLGFAAAMSALVWRHQPSATRSALPAIAGSLGMAATGAFAVWVVGGLEPPLLAGLLAWAIVLSEPLLEEPQPAVRTILYPSALYGLICLTRPDGALFVAATCVTIIGLGRSRCAWRTAALLVSIPAALVVGQILFRLQYYDAWLPNTALPRLVLSATHVVQGGAYTWSGLWPMATLVAPALGALVVAARAPALRGPVSLAATPLFLWLGYQAMLGGDYIPGRRHFVPCVVLLAFLAAETWGWWVHTTSRVWRAVAWWTAGVSLVALLGMQLMLDREYRRALDEQWEWDGQVVGQMFDRAFRDQQPLLAVDAAGSLPYFSKLPSIDMLGLNDRYLATHPPEDLGLGAIGHELGDGEYVLSREPDLIVFCQPKGGEKPCFASGIQMVQIPEFNEAYRSVLFLAEDERIVRSRVFVRIESPRIGIERDLDRIVIPGLFFSGHGSQGARFDGAGRLKVRLGKQPGLLRGVSLPAGEWQPQVDASSDVEVIVTLSDSPRPLKPGATPGSFVVPARQAELYDIKLTARRPVNVYAVILTR